MKKLLISAFEPFGGEEINPAKEAVLRLQGEGIHKLILPVEYETAGRLLFSEIGLVKPDIVIMVGQAGGRDAVTPERRAVNSRNAKAPDSAGRLCAGEKILEGGGEELPATPDNSACPSGPWCARSKPPSKRQGGNKRGARLSLSAHAHPPQRHIRLGL